MLLYNYKIIKLLIFMSSLQINKFPEISSFQNEPEIKSVKNSQKYNHEHVASSIYLFSDISSLIGGVWSSLSRFGQATAVASYLGLRKYLSVITGVSTVVSGNHMIEEAKKTNHVWGKIQGGLRITKGAFETLYGATQGVASTIETFASSLVNSLKVSILSLSADSFFCLSMLSTAISTLHNAGLAGDLNRDLSKLKNFPDQVAYLQNLAKDPKSKENLKHIIGIENFEKLPDLKPDELEVLKKQLVKKEMKNAIGGTVSLLSGVAVALGDIFTVGLFSKIITFAKPFITLAATYFDLEMFLGAKSSENESKMDKIMKHVVTALAIGIALAMFFAASGATGGALPAAVLAISIAMPLISSLALHKDQIKSLFNSFFEKMPNFWKSESRIA